tara:strand:- start:698 stop:2728 length:2031 start_codon:yes stop_codon:yes gene_type:complete
MASTLVINFGVSTNVLENTDLNVKINIGGSQILQRIETFRPSRTANGIVKYPNPYDVSTVAENYSNAWNIDYQYYSGESVLPSTYFGNGVTITLLNDNWQFDSVTGTSIDNGSVTFTVNNDAPVIEKKVTINDYIKSVYNKCEKCFVQLLCTGGNGFYNVYVNNVLQITNQASPINVMIDRAVSNYVKVTDTSGVVIRATTTFANRKIETNDISTTVSNLSTGSTVNVKVEFISPYVSPYEYSIDGTNYQDSNIFTGQSAGSYTIYVKDNFDCVSSKQIVIDGTTTSTETVFTISNINSFRFAKIETGKKNQLNTLSYNELRLNKYPYYQQYIENEIVTTQFKTNAQYINCFYIDKDDTVTTLSEIKKTNNIGLRQKSTSTYFNLGNGRSGVYFGVVNLLDYNTESFIETVNYGFALPQWASTKGSLVTIDGIGQLPVDDIVYSDEYSSFVLAFNLSYLGNPITNKIISAEYNLQPYEIYEFDTTVTKDLSLVIEVGSDSNNIDFQHVSECVKKVNDSEFLFDITYWDDQNKGDMNYQTGIKNKLRLNGYQDDIGEQETEGYNGDQEFYVTDNVVYDVQRFTFKQLSTQMANKLRLAVAHKNILINGLFYKLAESPEVTGDGNYNLKIFSVLLKQSGEQFLTTEQENITNTSENSELLIALAAAKGKGVLSWTKNY